ncbi:GTP-binding protein rhoC [Friedmanniomyces simplex]|uniref:GTP-binding protein rhoC n=1 Tax=Friedmanniomyces simplex TaxID=329884 RepID=A0A4U0Y2L3_9PEZI|nr:GTP-binding protein rhoC [Friedmanniomyces simplex]
MTNTNSAFELASFIFDRLHMWYPEVLHFCTTTPIILCGLKFDLRHKRTSIELFKTQDLTPVTQQQGRAVA